MSARILIVEDDRALADNLREIFEASGGTVHTATSGAEAEAAAARQRFDLAMVDLQLDEGESGLALIPRLRQLASDGEIIVITGNATLDTAIEAVRHGVFAYLTKPFRTADLLQLGERALAQVALRRERTALSKELARSETLHRAVFDSVDSLIVGVDEAHRVQLWNRSAADVTGWSGEEVMGEDACALLLPEDQRAALDAALDAVAGGDRSEVELVIRTRDGEPRVVAWRLRPLMPEGTRSAMVLMAGNDVTEERELERRAAEAEAMAAMGRLTSSLAHEIRNPLNAAKLQLELLKRSARKIPDEATRESLGTRADVVQDEIERLAKLLDDFMGLARPKHLAMAPFDLGALVREIDESRRRAGAAADDASRPEITLGVEVEGEPLTVYGDEGRLRQALLDLILNATDALEDAGGGHVWLSARPDGTDRVQIRVEDDGPGLEKPGEEVLQPFVTTKRGGTGLGLPIVQKLTELHQGTLELGPREGGGTSVVLRLPRARAGDTVDGEPT